MPAPLPSIARSRIRLMHAAIFSDAEIADTLNLSPSTVTKFRQRHDMPTHSRTAVQWAERARLSPPSTRV